MSRMATASARTVSRALPFVVATLPVIALAACSDPAKDEPLALEDRPILHDTNFGGVYIDISIDDFNELGFKFGDRVDIEFSNGYTLESIPYYNGYYVNAGSPLLIGYPGYPYIEAAFNYGGFGEFQPKEAKRDHSPEHGGTRCTARHETTRNSKSEKSGNYRVGVTESRPQAHIFPVEYTIPSATSVLPRGYI